MKKLLYLLPVAALALASCSNEEGLVKGDEVAKAATSPALQIYPVVNANTRASWDDSNFAAFTLDASGQFQTDATTINTGAAALTGKAVTKGEDGKWTIAGGPYYWPSKQATSSFTAYNHAAGEYTAPVTGDQEDIVVAFAPEASASDYEAGVPLYFRHILSQVVFKADNADKDDITVKVAGVRINNVYTTGEFTLPTASTETALGYTPWSEQKTSNSYKGVAAVADAIELTNGAAQTLAMIDPQMLVPQTLTEADLTAGTGSYLSVLIKVTDNTGAAIYPTEAAATADPSGNGFAWAAVDLSGMTWEAGKKYIYTLHFTKTGLGKVDPNQEDGGTDDPTDDGDPGTDNPEEGDDIVDSPVPLVLTVTVVDWEEVPSEKTL